MEANPWGWWWQWGGCRHLRLYGAVNAEPWWSWVALECCVASPGSSVMSREDWVEYSLLHDLQIVGVARHKVMVFKCMTKQTSRIMDTEVL